MAWEAACVYECIQTGSSFDKVGWPTYAYEQAIWALNSYFIQTPFAVPKYPARLDNKIIDSCSKLIYLWCSDEDLKRIAFRNIPRWRSSWGKVNFAIPSSHYCVGLFAARPFETEAFPEDERRLKIVSRHNGKSPNRSRP